MYIQSINQSTHYLNFNGKKSQNKDKKVSNPVSQQTSTLKAVPLAVLMALNMGNISSAEPNFKTSDNDANIVTTEVVSSVKSSQQSELNPSQELKDTFKKLYCMMFFSDVKGESIYLKKTDKVSIGIVKDQYDPETGKRLGDAILIKYKYPENEKEYNRLKNAGQKPEVADYPLTETYLIPITNEGVRVDAKKNLLLEDVGEERCAKLKIDKNCFKYEEYPEPVCPINSFGYISKNDELKYFNYNKDGWCSFHNGNDRCGMTKEFFVSVDEAKLVLECINNYRK